MHAALLSSCLLSTCMLVLSSGTPSICMFSQPAKFPFGFAGYIQALMSTFKEVLEKSARTKPLLALPAKKPNLIPTPNSSPLMTWVHPHQPKAAAPSTSRRLSTMPRGAPPTSPSSGCPSGSTTQLGRVGRLAASLLPGGTNDEALKLDEGFSAAAHLVNDRLRVLKTHNRIASQCGLVQLKDKAGDRHTISAPVYMVLCRVVCD